MLILVKCPGMTCLSCVPRQVDRSVPHTVSGAVHGGGGRHRCGGLRGGSAGRTSVLQQGVACLAARDVLQVPSPLNVF